MSEDNPTVVNVSTEQPKGTVGVERKVNLGNYEHEVVSAFVQFPIVFGDEEANVVAAGDAAFLAKSIVYSQLGLVGELSDGVLKVKAAFPATVAEAPRAEGNDRGSAAAPTSAPSAEASTGSSRAAAPASDAPICPECEGELWDNRPENVKRKAAGKKALPEGRCKAYADPPKGTGCTGVVWNWSKGK